ncbi:2-phospho-L-lactate guanylyltransferase [bacterium BMS3Abin04]|nr:2-phospho-L-lactate guanylyltransferase [bacterium BMS3Abin04]
MRFILLFIFSVSTLQKFIAGTIVKNKSALIIFVKFPEHGKVKTRLAETVGNEKALQFYSLCSHNVFNEVNKLSGNIDVYIFYSDKGDKHRIKGWITHDFKFKHQINSDLGNRMKSAFVSVLEKGYSKALIIGTDVPDMSVEVVNQAFTYLEKFDVVVGPSNDGGYYLLGMRKLIPELFSGIKWSTQEVYQKTIIKLLELGMNSKVLPVLVDVDTEDDLNSWLGNKNSRNMELKDKIGGILHMEVVK